MNQDLPLILMMMIIILMIIILIRLIFIVLYKIILEESRKRIELIYSKYKAKFPEFEDNIKAIKKEVKRK